MFNNMTPNLMVNDVKETVKFYKEVLDFELVNFVDDSEKGEMIWALIRSDFVYFMLQKKESLLSEYPIINASNPMATLNFYMEVDNIEKLYEDIKGKNSIKLILDMKTTVYGTSEFAIMDNNGYILTFAQKK